MTLGWTRRFERRARVVYNAARRSHRNPEIKLMQWSEWVRVMSEIDCAACAGVHARRRR